jgi:hypothetical protein
MWYVTVHKAYLSLNGKRHLGQFTVKCDICEKGFFSHWEVKKHKVTYLAKKLFRCDLFTELTNTRII